MVSYDIIKYIVKNRNISFKTDHVFTVVIIGGGTGGGPGPFTFFSGGVPNIRVYFYNVAAARMYLKLNKLTIQIKTQERA